MIADNNQHVDPAKDAENSQPSRNTWDRNARPNVLESRDTTVDLFGIVTYVLFYTIFYPASKIELSGSAKVPSEAVHVLIMSAPHLQISTITVAQGLLPSFQLFS